VFVNVGLGAMLRCALHLEDLGTGPMPYQAIKMGKVTCGSDLASAFRPVPFEIESQRNDMLCELLPYASMIRLTHGLSRQALESRAADVDTE